ncbi:MAG: thiamine-phosphate kinase [Bacteroidales bacterium]|nr:thiamine-phosphate kinase [Bacteroidales bacterium]
MENKISSLGEFGLIELIRDKFLNSGLGGGGDVLGIGDDCAVIPQGENDILVTTDLLVEDVHFLRSDAEAWQIGWKSVAVNLSDIAAMGGKPVGTFLSIALPSSLDTSWIESFVEGYKKISEEYRVPLLGGDTTSSKGPIAINLAVLGTIPHGAAKLRSTAKEGDIICVTGTLGDSGAGLNLVLKGIKGSNPEQDYLRRRHYEPTPRIHEGLMLQGLSEVHAMMDISDGLASDLGHILKASRVAAQIDIDRLPLSQELKSVCEEFKALENEKAAPRGNSDVAATSKDWNPEILALKSGEDYELLFTCSPEIPTEITKAIPGTPITPVGRIIKGTPHITYLKEGREIDLNIKGFTHF